MPDTDNQSQLIVALANRLGIPSDEAAVQRRILAELDAGASAKSQLTAILGALGEQDQGGAMQKIVDLIQKSQALLEAMPQLAELKDAKLKDEEKAVEEDVEQAMTACRIPAAAKDAMLFTRKGGVELNAQSGADDWKRRELARASFLQKYPVPRANEQHLLMSLATHRPVSSSITTPVAPPPSPGAGASSGGATLEAITACNGRNITEQAMAFVRDQPGGAKLSREDVHERACTMLASLRAQGVRMPPPPGRRLAIPSH
jgi:hypothetical protein